jgi:hypothetical protein
MEKWNLQINKGKEGNENKSSNQQENKKKEKKHYTGN